MAYRWRTFVIKEYVSNIEKSYQLLLEQLQGLSTHSCSWVSAAWSPRATNSPQWYRPAFTQHMQVRVSTHDSTLHKHLLSHIQALGRGRADLHEAHRHLPHSPHIILSDEGVGDERLEETAVGGLQMPPWIEPPPLAASGWVITVGNDLLWLLLGTDTGIWGVWGWVRCRPPPNRFMLFSGVALADDKGGRGSLFLIGVSTYTFCCLWVLGVNSVIFCVDSVTPAVSAKSPPLPPLFLDKESGNGCCIVLTRLENKLFCCWPPSTLGACDDKDVFVEGVELTFWDCEERRVGVLEERGTEGYSVLLGLGGGVGGGKRIAPPGSRGWAATAPAPIVRDCVGALWPPGFGRGGRVTEARVSQLFPWPWSIPFNNTTFVSSRVGNPDLDPESAQFFGQFWNPNPDPESVF